LQNKLRGGLDYGLIFVKFEVFFEKNSDLARSRPSTHRSDGLEWAGDVACFPGRVFPTDSLWRDIYTYGWMALQEKKSTDGWPLGSYGLEIAAGPPSRKTLTHEDQLFPNQAHL
jgi:hypothetical protein